MRAIRGLVPVLVLLVSPVREASAQPAVRSDSAAWRAVHRRGVATIDSAAFRPDSVSARLLAGVLRTADSLEAHGGPALEARLMGFHAAVPLAELQVRTARRERTCETATSAKRATTDAVSRIVHCHYCPQLLLRLAERTVQAALAADSLGRATCT